MRTRAPMLSNMEVFETEDFPENVDPCDREEGANKASSDPVVHLVDLPMQTSFGRFKGKELDTRGADYSDHITRQAVVHQDIFEVDRVCPREDETILQRYHRLKQELTELQEELACIMAEGGGEGGEVESQVGVSPSELLQEVDLMQSQLSRLQLDRTLGSALFLSSPEHNLSSLLLKELKLQLAASTDQESSSSLSSKDPDHHPAVYEVYSTSEAAKFTSLSKLSEVEKKLVHLEALVGGQSATVSTAAAGLDVEHGDLSSAVLSLQAKVALLDPTHISAVSDQLRVLLTLLDEVKKKSDQVDPAQQQKLSEALKTIEQMGSLVPLVPDLVNRLQTLRELHDRAAQFAGAVSHMSSCQGDLARQVTDLKSMLKQVNSSLELNLSQVDSNLRSVEERIAALQ